jgi:hypothetical protein
MSGSERSPLTGTEEGRRSTAGVRSGRDRHRCGPPGGGRRPRCGPARYRPGCAGRGTCRWAGCWYRAHGWACTARRRLRREGRQRVSPRRLHGRAPARGNGSTERHGSSPHLGVPRRSTSLSGGSGPVRQGRLAGDPLTGRGTHSSVSLPEDRTSSTSRRLHCSILQRSSSHLGAVCGYERASPSTPLKAVRYECGDYRRRCSDGLGSARGDRR